MYFYGASWEQYTDKHVVLAEMYFYGASWEQYTDKHVVPLRCISMVLAENNIQTNMSFRWDVFL